MGHGCKGGRETRSQGGEARVREEGLGCTRAEGGHKRARIPIGMEINRKRAGNVDAMHERRREIKTTG